MNRSVSLLLACLTILLGASLVLAEGTVAQVYRSPHGRFGGLAVDPGDGSVWAIAGTSVVHLDGAGHVLQQDTSMGSPALLAVNPADGSCWVTDGGVWDGTQYVGYSVVHLSRDGKQLWRGSRAAGWLSVNPSDGSIWLLIYDSADLPGYLLHLAADGRELGRVAPQGVLRIGPFTFSPFDGSFWAYDGGTPAADPPDVSLCHLAADGTLLARHRGVGFRQAVNPVDGSCWTGGAEAGPLLHISASDQVLWNGTAYKDVSDIVVNPTDSSCWVQYYPVAAISNCGQTLAHLAADGSELSHTIPPVKWIAFSFAVNPADRTLWVGSGYGWMHLAADGSALWADRPGEPLSVAVDSATGGYWMGGRDCAAPRMTSWVARYDALGNELWRKTSYMGKDDTGQDVEKGLILTDKVAPDLADGSLWVADEGTIVHFAADGTQVPFPATYGTGMLHGVTVDPRDRSVWVAQGNELRHYGREGASLGAVTCTDLTYVYAAQVTPSGLAWAIGYRDVFGLPSGSSERLLVRIGADGAVSTIPGVVPIDWWNPLSVDPRDGSVWVIEFTQVPVSGQPYPPRRVTHVAANGALLWQGGEEYNAECTSVDPRTGNCWVVGGGGPAYLLSPAGEELGRTTESYVAYFVTTDAADGTLWLLDETSGLCRVADTGPYTDVPATSWAAPALFECTAADIISGYGDGTYHPAEQITRDQMAVYIARALCGSDAAVPEGPSTPSFADVPAAYWAYRQIEYCKAQNIVQGYEDGAYHPELALDRGQMATFLARAIAPAAERPDLTSYLPPATPSFADVAPDFWAYKPIEYVRWHYVASGYPDGQYHPEIPCTRDQMAVFMARAFHLFQ